jgi:hypothetical protein
MNTRHNIMLAGLLLGLAHAPAALADDPPPPAEAPPPPEVTMRIIENPDAVASESITRRLQLPPAPPATQRDETRGRPSEQERAQAPESEARHSEAAQEAAERGREMTEQAAERREEFGRSRAEEMRPERPEPPTPPRP